MNSIEKEAMLTISAKRYDDLIQKAGALAFMRNFFFSITKWDKEKEKYVYDWQELTFLLHMIFPKDMEALKANVMKDLEKGEFQNE